MYKGIDISMHNGNVNMQKVKDAGYSFAMIRDGYGDLISFPTQKDPTFERNYKNAKAAGVGVGAYHYLYATTPEGARREAQGFLNSLSGKQFDYPVALDIEESEQYKLSNATVEAIVKAFMDVIEKAGYYCLLYSYQNFLEVKMSASFRAKYDVWCANIIRKPSIAYGVWQYSFTGSVPGCVGDVDLDQTENDYPKIIKSGGFNGYKKPKPTEYLDKPEDKWWFKGMEKTPDGKHGLYAVKQRMKAKGYTYLDDTGGFGAGTEKAVNALLKEWGYIETGIIGKNFVDRVMK